MAYDKNYNPSPRAIAGLFLKWAWLHGHAEPGAMPAVPIPTDLFMIFAAPPIDNMIFPYVGKPERRQRDVRRAKKRQIQP